MQAASPSADEHTTLADTSCHDLQIQGVAVHTYNKVQAPSEDDLNKFSFLRTEMALYRHGII